MKKILFLISLMCLMTITTKAQTYAPDSISYNIVEIPLQAIDLSQGLQHNRRSYPRVPVVYYSHEMSSLYFDSPCYDCYLELVIPGSDTVAYECDIPDGSETIELPTYLSGEYELRIIRGSWCFYGTIVL